MQPKGDRRSTRQRKNSNGKALLRCAEQLGQKTGEGNLQAKEGFARLDEADLPEQRAGEDLKLTLQRVLEAHALLAHKLDNDSKDTEPLTSLETVEEDVSTKNTINMAREVLTGFRKGSIENGRVSGDSTSDDGNGVKDWSASLIRSGLSKPLAAKGSLWRRDLGTVHDLHGLTDQPDIVRKVGTSNW